jgi:hypothetical protein
LNWALSGLKVIFERITSIAVRPDIRHKFMSIQPRD